MHLNECWCHDPGERKEKVNGIPQVETKELTVFSVKQIAQRQLTLKRNTRWRYTCCFIAKWHWCINTSNLYLGCKVWKLDLKNPRISLRRFCCPRWICWQRCFPVWLVSCPSYIFPQLISQPKSCWFLRPRMNIEVGGMTMIRWLSKMDMGGKTIQKLYILT